MPDALERAVELVGRYDDEIRALLPEDAEIFDAHLHLGTDIDGMIGDYEQLEGLMRQHGISRAFMFCLDEPDRHPAFSAANDRTLRFVRVSGNLPLGVCLLGCPSTVGVWWESGTRRTGAHALAL